MRMYPGEMLQWDTEQCQWRRLEGHRYQGRARPSISAPPDLLENVFYINKPLHKWALPDLNNRTTNLENCEMRSGHAGKECLESRVGNQFWKTAVRRLEFMWQKYGVMDTKGWLYVQPRVQMPRNEIKFKSQNVWVFSPKTMIKYSLKLHKSWISALTIVSHLTVLILNNREILRAEELGWGLRTLLWKPCSREQIAAITTEETTGERAPQRLAHQNLNNAIQVQPIVKLGLFFRCWLFSFLATVLIPFCVPKGDLQTVYVLASPWNAMHRCYRPCNSTTSN